MRGDLVIGSTFPNYELLDHQGNVSSLAEVQGRDPLVVLLAHGTYCAEEHWYHERMVGLWRAFALGSVGIVTITTDDLLDTNSFRDRLGAPWVFFSDPARMYQRDLDIADYTDPLHDSMVPHTFVLSPDLRVYNWYAGHWLWGRPTESELWRDLRTISRAIRPDWDLADPGLRQRWIDGHRRDFRPYGRSIRDDVELFDDRGEFRFEAGA